MVVVSLLVMVPHLARIKLTSKNGGSWRHIATLQVLGILALLLSAAVARVRGSAGPRVLPCDLLPVRCSVPSHRDDDDH